MLKMSKIDQMHLRAVMLCMSKMGKEHTDTFFIIPFLIWYCLNVMLSMSKMLKIDQIHLRAVMLCMSKMSKMSKIDQIHLRAQMLCMSKMSKMSKIDQIHLRAVMLCMSKMLKMGKEHTHTFWLITSLIFLQIFNPKKVLEILYMSKHVEDVEDYL